MYNKTFTNFVTKYCIKIKINKLILLGATKYLTFSFVTGQITVVL